VNLLRLGGWGVKIRVNNLKSKSELEVTNGREDKHAESTMRFHPRRFPYSSIIIDGHSGYVSLQAFHWLSKHKVPVFIMNFDGSLISSILPPIPIKADLRAAQFRACADPAKKFMIAKCIVQAKIARSLQVLDWLAQRYDIEREVRLVKKNALGLGNARTVVEIRSVEGRVARRYWEAYTKALPECFDFHGRMTSSHQNNASDPVNSALNYGYGVLEGECRRAINVVGLEPSVGFLHDFSGYQTKESLIFDLQELFRWIVDLSVMRAFESGALDLPHFYFTGDDYRYRFDVEAKTRFIGLLREQFNSGADYRGRILKWDTVIEQKAMELSRYLTEGLSVPDFAEPFPILERRDNTNLRNRILSLTQSDAARVGIGKSTLHYLRTRARNKGSMRTYHKVTTRIAHLDP
jgi:CRISPR-associated protein Cas1